MKIACSVSIGVAWCFILGCNDNERWKNLIRFNFVSDRKELEKWLSEPLENRNKDYSDEDNEYEQKFDTTNHLDNVPMSDGLSDNFRPNFTVPKELWGNDEITYESKKRRW